MFRYNSYSPQLAVRQEGAVLVETIIVLPIFLLLVFILLWISYIRFAYFSLASAVNTGVIAGITRGNAELVNGGISTADDGFITNMNDPKLFSNGLGRTEEPYIVYQAWLAESNYKAPLVLYPPEAFAALFYTLEHFRVSMGNGLVRFPCDPNGDDPADGAGCLRCEFMNPTDMQAIDPKTNQSLCKTNLDVAVPRHMIQVDFPVCQDRIGIKCTYAPTGMLVNKIFAFIGGQAGQSPFDITYQKWGYLAHNPGMVVDFDKS